MPSAYRSGRFARGCWVAAALALSGAACGNLTSGGLGEVEVIVAADSVPSGASSTNGVAAAAYAREGASPAATSALAVQGTLTLRVQVYARGAPGRWAEVTRGVQEVVLPLEEGAPVTLVRRTMPTGTYDALRTVFLQVVANVEGGLVLDDVPIRGPVTVELGPEGRIEVESPVALMVEEDREARIELNLHANRWLRLLDRERLRVQTEDFRGEVRVRQRP